jgi:hypothetical protein
MNFGFTPLRTPDSTALFLASGLEAAFLLQKNLHVLKVKGHRVGLEEIVADHACKGLANGGANVLDASCCRFAHTPSKSAFQPYG